MKVELLQKSLFIFSYLSGNFLSKCLIEKSLFNIWIDLNLASSFVLISNVVSYISKIFTVFTNLQNVSYSYEIRKINQTILFSMDFPGVGKMNVSQDLTKNSMLSLTSFSLAPGSSIFSAILQTNPLNNNTATQLNPVKAPLVTNTTQNGTISSPLVNLTANVSNLTNSNGTSQATTIQTYGCALKPI